MAEFRLIGESENFLDYQTFIPDKNEVGMSIEITIVRDDHVRDDHNVPVRAYMVVRGDDMDGREFFSHTIEPIPLDWALRICGAEDIH